MALCSMTGYGNAEFQWRGRHYFLEIKTVNHRYFKITSRLPEVFQSLQLELESMVKSYISRGSVSLYLRETAFPQEGDYEVNEKLLFHYFRTLKKLEKKFSLSWQGNLEQLLLLPGVVVTKEEEWGLSKELEEKAKAALEKALKKLVSVRKKEGKFLEKEIKGYLRSIQKRLNQVEKLRGKAREDFQQKLRERLEKILEKWQVSLPEETLIRELAIYAEKMEIEEEILRLRSHLEQFFQLLKQSEPVGRQLEFLTQEMVRETNTMGAKTTHLPTLELIMDMKNFVDKIREQVQNIE